MRRWGSSNSASRSRDGLDPTDNRNRILDSDSDQLSDFDETKTRASEDLTAGDDTWHYYINRMSDEDLKKQFNPLVKDNFAPTFEITSIEKQADYYVSVSFLGQKVGVYKSGYIKVEGEAFDITGIRYVKVTVETDDENVYTFEAQSENDLPTSMAFSTETDLSVDEYLFGKYPVTVEACDGAGNTAMVEKEVKGVFNDLAELFLDFLVDSWNTAVEVATALGDMIWEWIVEQVNKLWDAVLEPMKELVEEFIGSLIDSFMSFFEEVNDFYWDGESEPTDPDFNMAKELDDVEKAKNLLIALWIRPLFPSLEIFKDLEFLLKFIEPFQYLLNPTSLLMLVLGEVPGISLFMESIISQLVGETTRITKGILDFLIPLFGIEITFDGDMLKNSLINPIALLNWARQLSWNPVFKGVLNGISLWLNERVSSGRSFSDDEEDLIFGVIGLLISGVVMSIEIGRWLESKDFQELQSYITWIEDLLDANGGKLPGILTSQNFAKEAKLTEETSYLGHHQQRAFLKKEAKISTIVSKRRTELLGQNYFSAELPVNEFDEIVKGKPLFTGGEFHNSKRQATYVAAKEKLAQIEAKKNDKFSNGQVLSFAFMGVTTLLSAAALTKDTKEDKIILSALSLGLNIGGQIVSLKMEAGKEPITWHDINHILIDPFPFGLLDLGFQAGVLGKTLLE